MSNFLLILLMVLTFAMFFYNKAVEARAARLRAAAEDE
jgi:multiple sugar transport system permease protein